jgi:hypothetical protein
MRMFSVPFADWTIIDGFTSLFNMSSESLLTAAAAVMDTLAHGLTSLLHMLSETRLTAASAVMNKLRNLREALIRADLMISAPPEIQIDDTMYIFGGKGHGFCYCLDLRYCFEL